MLDRLIAAAIAHPVISTAAAILVLGWLVVSFLSPGAQRRKLEWIAATGMYVAFLGFFSNLVLRSIATDSTAGMIAFGFLALMFGCGLVVCSVRTVQVLIGSAGSEGTTATH